MNQKSQSSGFRAEIANLKLPAVGKICFSLLADQRSWGAECERSVGANEKGSGGKGERGGGEEV